MEKELAEQRRIEQELAAAHRAPSLANGGTQRAPVASAPAKAKTGPAWGAPAKAVPPPSASAAPSWATSSANHAPTTRGGSGGSEHSSVNASVSPRRRTTSEKDLHQRPVAEPRSKLTSSAKVTPASASSAAPAAPPPRPSRDDFDVRMGLSSPSPARAEPSTRALSPKGSASLPAAAAASQVTPPPETQRRDSNGGGGGGVAYTKIVRVTNDWTPASGTKEAAAQLALVQGELIGVTAEENGFFVGYNMQGVKGAFPCNRASVVRSSVDAFNNVVVLGRRSGGGRRRSASVRQAKGSPSTRLLEGSNATPRNKIVGEILATEQSYGDALEQVVANFRGPMSKLPADNVNMTDVFQNVDTILQLSRLLQAELSEAVESWKPNATSVAAPFLELGPFFACYETYAAGFERAQKLMDALNADPNFAPFLKSAKSNGLTLDALLVMPVQRMPRYKLLLEDLLKHTPESHPDHAALRDTVAMVSTLAREINEKIRSSEKTQTLIEDGANRLARFVSKERTVLLQAAATVKIDNAKPLVMGKVKAEVYILTDSLLLLLKRSVRAPDYDWMADFNHLFWPTRLLWAKKAAADTVVVGGPFFGLTLHIKKECGPFCDVLLSEVAKHKSSVSTDQLRTGIHVFPEAGFKYDGEWRGGVAGGHMSGKGSMALGLGVLYTGAFEKDEIRGVGKMRLGNGDVLSGTFANGLLTGDGTIEYANGDTFRGKFVNGVRVGAGEFRGPSQHYSGEWADDNATGQGRLVAGQAVFVGQFQDGAFVSGEYTAPDGTVYSGTFVCSTLLEGTGTARYPDKSAYSGGWKRGLREGEGHLELPDGSVLTGTFRNDTANGPCNFAGGPQQWLKSYAGGYQDGRPHAKQAEAVFADGSRFVGSFKEGLMDKGEWTMADGQTSVSGRFGGGMRLAGKGVYKFKDGDVVEAVPDAANRMPVKGRYLPVALPANRPSFCVNIAQGPMKK